MKKAADMKKKVWRSALSHLSRVRHQFAALVVFVMLLGLINWLVVNQRLILYLFYVPVILSAWFLSKRVSVGIACVAGLLVVALAIFIPGKLTNAHRAPLVWTELAIWGGVLIVTAYLVSTLRASIQRALQNLQRAYAGVLAILSRLLQAVDADTEAHSTRVSAWAVRIAEALRLNREMVEETRIAGLLHDVGKVDMSVELLRKAASLSKEEQAEMREHAARGAAIVKPVGGMLSRIADAIENHHEQYDGSGYKGLKGEEISLVARIITVADAFDALLSDRPYRKGIGTSEAIDAIMTSAGTHFDPSIAATLKEIVYLDGERTISAAAYTRDEW